MFTNHAIDPSHLPCYRPLVQLSTGATPNKMEVEQEGVLGMATVVEALVRPQLVPTKVIPPQI